MRYFLVFYSGSHNGWVNAVTNGVFPNMMEIKEVIAKKNHIFKEHFSVSNIIELSKEDHDNAIKNM